MCGPILIIHVQLSLFSFFASKSIRNYPKSWIVVLTSHELARAIFLSAGHRIIYIYTGCPKKKRNGGFSVPCDLKKVDTKIIEFGWAILILCPFLETQSFSNFAWFLRPLSVDCVGNGPLYARFRLRCIFCWHGSMGFLKNTIWKAFPDKIYAHRSQKSSEKLKKLKKWA